MRTLEIEDLPEFELEAFEASFERPLGELMAPAAVKALLEPGAKAPQSSSDELRGAVREALRAQGFKPTGRSKPASEYLIKAQAEGLLRPINPVVDACNAVSLHSGLPISVVDLELATAPLAVRRAPKGASYVFNAGGQSLDLGGLACLWDAQGPCANAVKDSQRTKTHPGTQHVLVLVWGVRALPGRAARSALWYRELLEAAGARTVAIART